MVSSKTNNMIKSIFFDLLEDYSVNRSLKESLWNEIETNYSEPKRFYHNLNHLDSIYLELKPIKTEIKDWNSVLFSMFYHDVVYDVKKKNNEERSAEYLEKVLAHIKVPSDQIINCSKIIKATKTHDLSSDNDTNLFLDADISIFGKNWEGYLTYSENIRNEYSLYPSFIYNRERRKVLKKFLDAKQIYHTSYFSAKYSRKAKENIKRELILLS